MLVYETSMSETGNRKSKRRALPPEGRRQLSLLVDRYGQVGAANRLGISVQTVASLAAGFEANGSTVELIERKLAEVAAAAREEADRG